MMDIRMHAAFFDMDNDNDLDVYILPAGRIHFTLVYQEWFREKETHLINAVINFTEMIMVNSLK